MPPNPIVRRTDRLDSMPGLPMRLPALIRSQSQRQSRGRAGRGLPLLCSALSLVALSVVACDRFFRVDMTITDCATGAPLADGTLVLTSEAGVVATFRADYAGRIAAQANAPERRTVRAEVGAPGYQAQHRRFEGSPSAPVTVCLARAHLERW